MRLYAHLHAYRVFNDLKEDGTFGLSGSVSDHGMGKIDFVGDTYLVKKIAYCESDTDNHISYFIENTPVSKKDFDTFERAKPRTKCSMV